jgi:uncharacterized membrane protein YdjX (TVP38/TMEM64 family)
MPKRKLLLRILIITFIISSLLAFIQTSDLHLENLTPERIRTLTNNNILLILFVMFGIMFLQNLLNFIPIILVMSANVALFGLWKGFLFSLICSVIASTIIFIIFRYIFKDFKAPTKFDAYREKIENNGFLYVLIARLIPIMPTNIINMVAGVSSIKLIHYVLATVIGNGIYTLIISSALFRLFT